MAKTAYEKALEKQQRENQKIAAQEARRQYASTIVSGQPLKGCLTLMTKKGLLQQLPQQKAHLSNPPEKNSTFSFPMRMQINPIM